MIKDLVINSFGFQIDDNLPYVSCYKNTREDLITFFGKAGFKVGAEIGVWNGLHAKSMFNKIADLKLYCVDSWCGYNQERYFTDQDLAHVYNDAKNNLKGLNAELIKMKSIDAVKLIDDKSLDFVYIDACHYFNEVMLDIILWTPKVKQGGIVSGHDFKHLYKCGVVEAVTTYANANKIREWFATNEDIPSWFWVAE